MPLIEFQNEGSFEETDLSLSLLEMSLKHEVPHLHVCGGTARCSTCRVMVVENPQNVLPRNVIEEHLAQKREFGDHIRLACQMRITGPIKVRRLVFDDQDADLVCGVPEITGRESNLAVLFADIRDFTAFAEGHLPYDTVHILNRYFYQMGNAVLKNGGYIDKYIGDGIMALFGAYCDDPLVNCYNAVSAGLQMLEELQKVNEYLKRNFDTEFRIGVGIHYGEVILGELGHPSRRQLTAIGDTVNIASRVETSTKTFKIPMLVSEDVRRQLLTHLQTGRVVEAELKGKTGTHKLYEAIRLRGTGTQAIDHSDLRRRLKSALMDVVNGQKAPLFLRLAYHDAGTYSKSKNCGGANGSIRFEEELKRKENAGLEIAVRLLEPIKAMLREISWADLIAFAGAEAIRRAGGPEIYLPFGRMDGAQCTPEGMMASETLPFADLKTRFMDMGFNAQELVALSGAHTVGRVKGRPFTDDWFNFNNSYFRLLLEKDATKKEALLPTDRALLDDPECRTHVARYAADEQAFFIDFAAAYRKMTLLGTGLQA